MNKKNIIERKKAEIEEKENLQRNSYLIESASIQFNNNMAWVLYFLEIQFNIKQARNL